MSIYKVTFGTPEKFTPTHFSPKPKHDVKNLSSQELSIWEFTKTNGGCKIELPLNPDVGIFGFGLQLKGFNHISTKKTIRPNADPISDTGDSHAPVPFFVTSEGWGVFIDTARYATFYCGYTKKGTTQNYDSETKLNVLDLNNGFSDLYQKRSSLCSTVVCIDIPTAQGVDVYLFKGDTIMDVVCQYNMFSGGGCEVPLWGLGNLFRCHAQFDDTQVEKMANDIRQMKIPCDIIGLEPGWQTKAYSSTLVWDETRFPNYEKTLKTLTDNGFKVNLWEQSFIHPSSPLFNKLTPYSGDYLVWSGLVPDFATKEASDIFTQHHLPYSEIGVTGYKLDECDGSDYTGQWSFPNCSEFPSGLDGEQYHNLFGLLYCKTMLRVLENKKTLSEVRNMGALSASYPFVLYSDLYGHKDFIRGVANSGFSGLLWSPEVRDAKSKADMLRRVQTTIFSVQSLINGSYLKEMPWVVLSCTDEIRKLFETRMKFVPYLYSAFYDYQTTGKPPVRAMVCDFPNDRNTYNIDDQYMFGDCVLVAPMTEDQDSRKVYLPDGDWYNFYDNKRYVGGTYIEITTQDVPVFIKANTILPLAKPIEYIEQDTCFEITLFCYGDTKKSSCVLIEDDGVTYSSPKKVIYIDDSCNHIDSSRYKLANKIQII